jgi:serine/threonine protein kinase
MLGSQSLYGQLKGTPGYMTPEQLDKARQVDPLTHICGLGGILYKLLTGSARLEGTEKEIVAATKMGSIIPSHAKLVNGGVPEALSRVTMKALSVLL